MAQEKQNSVKILQSKPKRTINRSRSAILYGMVAVIALACFLMVYFFFARSASDQTVTSVQDTNEPAIQHNSDNESHGDESDFQNQAKDKELSGLFKHPKTNTTVQPEVQKPESSSPFDIILGHEKKVVPVQVESKTTKPVATQRPIAPQKPLTPQVAVTAQKPVSPPAAPLANAKAEPQSNASLLNKLDIQKELDNPLLNNKNVAPTKAKEE